MATGSHQSFLVTQGSDDVFEKVSTDRNESQTRAGTNLSGITAYSKSLDGKEFVSSEKGQRARDHFRSSGYGTGSNENVSVNSVSYLCSSSLPEEAVPAVTSALPQSTHISILCTEASDCVENDFKPKNGTSVSTRINALANSAVNNFPIQDSIRPSQVNLRSNNLTAFASLQSTRTAENKTVSAVSSDLTTEKQQADTEQRVSDINQQRSPDHCLMLNTRENHVQETFSQNVQESSDLLQINNKNKIVAQPGQTQANGIVAQPGQTQANGIVAQHGQTQANGIVAQPGQTQANGISQATNSLQQTVATPPHQQIVVTHPYQQTGTNLPHQQTVATFPYQQTGTTPPHQQTVTNPPHQQTVVGNESASAHVQQNILADLSASADVEDRQPHMSSAASSSRYRSSHNFKSKPPLIRQNVLQHQTSETENWNPASRFQTGLEPLDSMSPAKMENQLHLTDMSMTTFYLSSCQTSTSSSGCGCRFDIEILGILDRCARCKEASCENPGCVQVRKSMMELQDIKKQMPNLTESSQDVLHTMAHHAFCECTRLRCLLPWCGETIECEDPFQRPKIMKQRIENYAEYCSLSNSSIEEYIKLSRKVPYNFMPVENQDWQRLIMLGDSRRTFLALPLTSDLPTNMKYWVIKKIYRKCESDNWNVYCKLREVQHSSIATMLWAAKYRTHLLVGYIFENLSLLDCLQGLPSLQLGLGTIVHVMLQLTSAANHLHYLGIVYLYWTSKNIQVECRPGDDFRVKICNFTCSVCLDSYDGGQLYLMLPAAIIMPELRNEHTVEQSSDAWGLGCLLNELVTGKPVWHEHRHLLDEDLHAQLGENPVPETPKIYPELLSLFQACWEVDLAKRVSTDRLSEILSELIRT